ncbi:MAG: InlB B-repeat-containing protein, partial [Clostridiales Family XIII bacterium]|jgi:uncharacterized repeat protein (TIGR02543 family)|nr:InlB B-repeat-containing protein [Clostridiales Family XIII bacterium]
VWKERTYTVNYNTDGGTPTAIPARTNVTWSAINLIPAEPVKTGYNFGGWNVSGGKGSVTTGVEAAHAYSQLVPGDTTASVTLIAQWTAKTDLRLYFDPNGGVAGTVTSKSGITYNAAVGALPSASAGTAPTRTGYGFQGWSTSSGESNSVNFTAAYITDFDPDKTVYAVWKKDPPPPPVMHTVKFMDHDGKTLSTQKVSHGAAATAPKLPVHADRVFTKWDKTFTNITADTVITAVCTIRTFTVKFVDHDGKVLGTQTVDYGKGASAPKNPSRSGYTFTGWDKGYSNITSDLTVKAKYKKNPPDKKPPVVTPTVDPVTPPTPDPAPADPVPAEVTEPEPTPAAVAAPEPVTAPEEDFAPIVEPEEAQPDPPTNTAETTSTSAPVPDSGFTPEEQALIDNQTGNPVTDIFNGNVPGGSFSKEGAWSLLSLLLSLVALAISVLLIVSAATGRNRREDEYHQNQYEDGQRKQGRVLKVLAIIAGILTPVIWLLLEDLSQPIIWINKWTLFVGVVFIIHIAMFTLYKVRSNKNRNFAEDEEAIAG